MKTKILEKRITPIIICTFVTLLMYLLDIKKPLLLLGDAPDYWDRGQAIYRDGFSLYHLPDAFRGYVFPLYLGTVGKLFGGG